MAQAEDLWFGGTEPGPERRSSRDKSMWGPGRAACCPKACSREGQLAASCRLNGQPDGRQARTCPGSGSTTAGGNKQVVSREHQESACRFSTALQPPPVMHCQTSRINLMRDHFHHSQPAALGCWPGHPPLHLPFHYSQSAALSRWPGHRQLRQALCAVGGGRQLARHER